MRITKPRRGRRAVKRLDMSPVLEALKDHRQWTALGVVTQPEDGTAHWQVYGDNADILVEVVLQPGQEPVTARLAAGMWIVPQVGDEVAVILPAGEALDFMPVITCILAHAVPPSSSGQAPQPQRMVLASPEILAHDGAGGAKELAFKDGFQALTDKVNELIADYKAHIHSGGTITPGNVTDIPTVAKITDAADPVGTAVLKAK